MFQRHQNDCNTLSCNFLKYRFYIPTRRWKNPKYGKMEFWRPLLMGIRWNMQCSLQYFILLISMDFNFFVTWWISLLKLHFHVLIQAVLYDIKGQVLDSIFVKFKVYTFSLLQSLVCSCTLKSAMLIYLGSYLFMVCYPVSHLKLNLILVSLCDFWYADKDIWMIILVSYIRKWVRDIVRQPIWSGFCFHMRVIKNNLLSVKYIVLPLAPGKLLSFRH